MPLPARSPETEVDAADRNTAEAPLPLVAQGEALPILLPAAASETERFAAAELARYLGRITGAAFQVQSFAGAGQLPRRAILVGRALAERGGACFSARQFGADDFLLKRIGERVLLSGISDRGTLYAAYGFLEALGCRWFAPNFDFYAPAAGEHVPAFPAPEIGRLDRVERPDFPLRKKHIEEGRSHTAANLKQLVDWMAKARLNVLCCPVDYSRQGETVWEAWRGELIPELRKRSLLIEVGGHGYQNFLPQEHCFDVHPEWFGVVDGVRSRADNVVFSTANEAAVYEFVANIKSYLRDHAEIDIFDCWPPDEARWSEAPEDIALGPPSERQMRLLNRVATELASEFPELRVEFIAYAGYLEPAPQTQPAAGLLMDFCPIHRSWEHGLFDAGNAENERYLAALQKWLAGPLPAASIAIYTYITKYAWRSFPVLVPHLIAEEARQFAELGLGGLSSYSEPEAWATYELDHYILARCSWNARLDIDRELSDYVGSRYGPAAQAVGKFLALVERIVPHAVAIPGTEIELNKQRRMIREFEPAADLLNQARRAAGDDRAVLRLVDKLDASHRYACNEMELQRVFAEARRFYNRNQFASLERLIAERRRLIEENAASGVIEPAWLEKKFGPATAPVGRSGSGSNRVPEAAAAPAAPLRFVDVATAMRGFSGPLLEYDIERVAFRTGALREFLRHCCGTDVAGKKIADLGAGYGGPLLWLCLDGSARSGLAVELDRGRVDVLKSVLADSGIDRIAVEQADLNTYDPPQADFDIVIAVDIFAARKLDLGKVVAVAKRLLRPGGLLVFKGGNRIYRPDVLTLSGRTQLLPPDAAAVAEAYFNGRDVQHRLHSAPVVAEALRQAGFTKIRFAGANGAQWRNLRTPLWARPMLPFWYVAAQRAADAGTAC